MTPGEYCRQKTVASGSSFILAFRFLPENKRCAMNAIYAFCREIDDVVDETQNAALATHQLAVWREEIECVFAMDGAPQHPVAQALRQAVREYALEKAHFMALIDGMAMDLSRSRYPDFQALSLYCYRVAGVVGFLSAGVFGSMPWKEMPDDLRAYAEHLGMAFQLTNILRDVGEDAGRGRLYLPQDELARFGVTASSVLAGKPDGGWIELLGAQAARIEDFYARAALHLARLPRAMRRAQWPGLVMAAIYHAILKKIVARNFPVLSERIGLSMPRKLWLVLQAMAGIV
jgi:phytoene synthase